MSALRYKNFSISSTVLLVAGNFALLLGIVLALIFWARSDAEGVPSIQSSTIVKNLDLSNSGWIDNFYNSSSDAYKNCSEDVFRVLYGILCGNNVDRSGDCLEKTKLIDQLDVLEILPISSGGIRILLNLTFEAESIQTIDQLNLTIENANTNANFSNLCNPLSSMKYYTLPPYTPQTTIAPFVPPSIVYHCSNSPLGKYVYQDIAVVYDLGSDPPDSMSNESSDLIAGIIKDYLITNSHFSFGETIDNLKALQIAIVPYPNTDNFAGNSITNYIPSFSYINSFALLNKTIEDQLKYSKTINLTSDSRPADGVCWYASYLNNQRRGVVSTLVLVIKGQPVDLEDLNYCLSYLKATEMVISVIAVGNDWDTNVLRELPVDFFAVIRVWNGIIQTMVASDFTTNFLNFCSTNLPCPENERLYVQQSISVVYDMALILPRFSLTSWLLYLFNTTDSSFNYHSGATQILAVPTPLPNLMNTSYSTINSTAMLNETAWNVYTEYLTCQEGCLNDSMKTNSLAKGLQYVMQQSDALYHKTLVLFVVNEDTIPPLMPAVFEFLKGNGTVYAVAVGNGSFADVDNVASQVWRVPLIPTHSQIIRVKSEMENLFIAAGTACGSYDDL